MEMEDVSEVHVKYMVFFLGIIYHGNKLKAVISNPMKP